MPAEEPAAQIITPDTDTVEDMYMLYFSWAQLIHYLCAILSQQQKAMMTHPRDNRNGRYSTVEMTRLVTFSQLPCRPKATLSAILPR